jgi:hypothetical protein
LLTNSSAVWEEAERLKQKTAITRTRHRRMQRAPMWWKQQIQGETILYAALDVFAKCLGSKFLGEARPWKSPVTSNDQN